MKYTLFFLLNNQQKQSLKKQTLSSKNKSIEKVGSPRFETKNKFTYLLIFKTSHHSKTYSKEIIKEYSNKFLSGNVRNMLRATSLEIYIKYLKCMKFINLTSYFKIYAGVILKYSLKIFVAFKF